MYGTFVCVVFSVVSHRTVIMSVCLFAPLRVDRECTFLLLNDFDPKSHADVGYGSPFVDICCKAGL